MDIGDKALGREWMAEQIALQRITTQASEEALLLVRFDAFGNNAQVKRLPHGDNCRNDCRVIAVLFQIADEATVDFQLVGRQALGYIRLE